MMNNNLVTKLLQYANSGDSDQAASDAMRKAAMKIEYLEEVLQGIEKDEFGNFSLDEIRGEDWFKARERALKAGNK